MDKIIRYYKRSVYGNDLLYPVDQLEAIQVLSGKKTITPAVEKGMKLLGFTFVEVLESEVNAFAGVKVGLVGKSPESAIERSRRLVG